jgi:hypothetical protein
MSYRPDKGQLPTTPGYDATLRMNETFDIPRLLELRKLTRAISEQIATSLKSHLTTLSPLFTPLPIFGEHIRGGPKKPVKGADKAFRELRSRFQNIAGQSPYSLPTELNSPLDIFSATPVLNPLEYTYEATDEGKKAQVSITSPLKWVFSYPDMTPKHILELLSGNRNLVREELHHCLLHCLALNLVLENRPGLVGILEGLRYSVETIRIDGLGDLPIILIGCPVSTQLPPDSMIIQNTEISGIPSFEEVVNISDIKKMPDPFKANILSITQHVSAEIYQELSP